MLKRMFALSNQGLRDLNKGIAATTLSNLCLIAPVSLLVMVIWELLNVISGQESSMRDHAALFICGTVVMFIIVFLTQWLQYNKTYTVAYKESANRRIVLAEKLRKLPLSFFGQRDLSDLTTTIMGDCTALERVFSNAIPQLFGTIFMFIITAIGLLVLDWRMGLCIVVPVPVAALVVFAAKKAQSNAESANMDAKRAAYDGVQEYLDTIQELKSCSREEEYLEGLEKKLDYVVKCSFRNEIAPGAATTTAQFILRFGLVAVMLVGGILVTTGSLSIPMFILFLLFAGRIYDPFTSCFMLMAEVFSALVSVKRMKQIDATPEQTGTNVCNNKGYDIEFKNVVFSYNEEPVLKGVSFVAKQGEVTALVGPSGSGKSTASKLAARFWDADSGTITLGGVDVKTVEPETLFKNYAIVFQDVMLFDETVMENIRLGRGDATDEEVMAAARAAQCEEFIQRLPQGYQTNIGENGSALSGGERQRISIARALLKNAPIVLLDEATASMDAESETLIQDALSVLLKDKTVMVIAHRMRTVANADNYRCAYALGGLVGIAYDYLYDANGVENRAAEIANCAIAGYTIEDNSTNPLQLGEAVVGGLIGVSKVNLNSCSAVVDIEVNCTHREAGDSGKLTRAQYGNFVRVGGLVGGVQYKVTNCYTGGSITVGDDTLNERVDEDGKLVTVQDSTKEKKVKDAMGTYVYIGGIGGSGFSSNFRNFSNKNGTDDGEPEYENCYTYTGLPTMQGTIMSISRIGSVADRYEWAPSVTITNCYYYAESDVQYNLPKYHCGKKSLATILANDEEKEKMLQGDLSYLSKYIGGRNHRPSYSIDLTKLSYEQMAGRKDVTKNGQDKKILELLNQNGDSVFGWVTVEEAQAEVHGKYSFPGKNIAVLDGQDYPFPTVLTQASEHTDSGRANLHYGDWPLVGPVWEKSSVTIDRITDYDAGIGSAVITAVLKLENMEDGKLGGLTLESFRSTNESIARVTGFQKVDEKTCRVTLEGLANGSVEITAVLDGHVARLMVSVTAELTIRMSDEIERAKQITVNEAATVPLGLAALDCGGKALTKDLSWTVANAETDIAQIVWKNGVPQSVRGIGAGETTLLITASYRINETETVTVSRIVPVTVLAKAADGTA